jgi:hypothetical protein
VFFAGFGLIFSVFLRGGAGCGYKKILGADTRPAPPRSAIYNQNKKKTLASHIFSRLQAPAALASHPLKLSSLLLTSSSQISLLTFVIQIICMYLDPESVSASSSRSSAARSSSVSDLEDDESEDEFRAAGESISEVERVSATAMADLKAIADCMISSGYGKECVKIYKIIRKSIIDEALYHLGHERLSLSQAQKMDWEVMELKIKNWLNAVKVAVQTLFYGEKILCDIVFSASASIRSLKQSGFAFLSSLCN